MLVLTVLLLAGMLFGVAAVSVGHGSPLSEAQVDRREPLLPADPVSAADVETLRFTMVLRGYRMDEVDAVLDRLSTELSVRDAEISRLRSGGSLGAQVLAGEASAADSRLGLSESHQASEPSGTGYASPSTNVSGAGTYSPYDPAPYGAAPHDPGAYRAPAPYDHRPATDDDGPGA